MLRQIFRVIFWGTVCLTLLSHPSLGQGNAYGKQKDPGELHDDDGRDQDQDQDRDRAHRHPAEIVFSSSDRDIIRDYFHNHYSDLPPGLAKRNGRLSPGLEKHLERDGTLPPGLQKGLTPFPEDLEQQLPRLPAIYCRGTIGVDVVILDRRTQRILDIVHDILRP